MGLNRTIRFILEHPMNEGRSFSALARFVKWQVQSRLKDEVIFDWIDQSKLVIRRGMAGATGNVYCGLHEYVDMSFVLHFLQPGDLFLDVGANIGSYTILAAKVCGAEVVAIEPDAKTATHLLRNIQENAVDELCTVVQAAVGRDEGTISFSVGRDTTNRVQESFERPSQTVPLTRIDSVLSNKTPTLVKIDVEGYELEALSGALGVLSSPHLLGIIIENTDPEVVSVLNKHGFSRFSYDPISKQLLLGNSRFDSSNGIFIKDASQALIKLRSSSPRIFRNRRI